MSEGESGTLERLEKLEERLVEAEVKLDTLATGQSVICFALERAGLIKDGEPVQSATWNPNKIKWEQARGAKGPYERYPAKDQKGEATEDYKAMLADLKAHNGKMMRGDYFYWLFSDAATVGRKLRKGKGPKPQAAPKADVEIIKAKFSSDARARAHHIIMTEEEYSLYKKRLYGVLEKGFEINIHREGSG